MLNTKLTDRGIELTDASGEIFGYITYSIEHRWRFESEHIGKEFWVYRNTIKAAEYDALAWYEDITHLVEEV